ncbi:hypothetical protein QUF74_12545 [Candidatus Halobeggiatoa sp. HSG11]|nr:hypothetical protein [Candidatus Halobeggiatoa sp. HSG11]
MLLLQIDNQIIEEYFKDSNTIQDVLEFIAINKIDITDEKNLTDRLFLALKEVSSMVSGEKPEKKARDFLGSSIESSDSFKKPTRFQKPSRFNTTYYRTTIF